MRKPPIALKEEEEEEESKSVALAISKDSKSEGGTLIGISGTMLTTDTASSSLGTETAELVSLVSQLI